jgi:hypothetical protein
VSKAEEFLKRERTATALREAKAKYHEAIKPDHVDKFGFGFNESGADDRWVAFAVPIRLQSHTGLYGRSSSSTFLSLPDPKVASNAFLKYINRHMWSILEGMAEIIDKDSGEAKAVYTEELRAELARLAEAGTLDTSPPT